MYDISHSCQGFISKDFKKAGYKVGDYVKILVDSLVGFVALFLMTKALGKSQITQITAFDFIAALVLGELVGNALYDPEVGIGQIIFATVLWSILIYLTELLTQKSKRTRSFLEGSPSIVIHKGKIRRDVMKKKQVRHESITALTAF